MNIFEALYEALAAGLRFLIDYSFYPGDGETFSLSRIVSLFIAFSISGAIAVFLSQGAVLKYFGPKANKGAAYFVASVSGAILAVCSCSVLPMFASIRRKGAGLGPAIAFLFSGPAINILAITLTFSDLGADIGFTRIIAAVVLAWIIGGTMFLLYRRSEQRAEDDRPFEIEAVSGGLTAWQRLLFFLTLLGMLLFGVYRPWPTIGFAVLLVLQLILFFNREDLLQWARETGSLVKKIIPLFIIGIFFAGILQSLLTEAVLVRFVGENLYRANIFAALIGAFMYFATMTEVPIVKALLDLGMHKGPATALLLAGPTLSLPNMIVIGKVLGVKKTFTYVSLVVVLGALIGWLAGMWIYS